VNGRTRLAEVLEREYPWCAEEVESIRTIFERYTERKRAQSALDYDDLLLFWDALCRHPAAGPAISGCSTTSWSTSTRTRTRSRPTSSRRSVPTATA
jgi:hypothetical protein